MPYSANRRCSTALLVLLYAVGTAGLFTSWFTSYHREAFQAQVKQAKASDLQRLFFSHDEYGTIEWIEDGAEFEWKGKMYDVSHIEKTSRGYEVLCENDELEEVLIAFLKKTRHNSDHPVTKGNPQPQFFSAYFLDYSSAIYLDVIPRQSRSYFAYHSLCGKVLAPPPEARII
jgi:hypothetical protein